MSINKCIIPECYIDSGLVEVLLSVGKDHVNHQKGNGTVAHEMQNKFNDDFCIGIIDEDRRPLDYLKEFEIIKETEDLRLWKYKGKWHYIIQIRPVIEKWILKACEKGGIKISDFVLPDNFRDLAKISKSVATKHDPRFVALFKEMATHCEAVKTLKDWIEKLRGSKFDTDIINSL